MNWAHKRIDLADVARSHLTKKLRQRRSSLSKILLDSWHHADEVEAADDSSGANDRLFRYRLLDSAGTDLGPLLTRTRTWLVGQRIERQPGQPLQITAVVPSAEEAIRAYLVVEPVGQAASSA